jgi:hypothetical protein
VIICINATEKENERKKTSGAGGEVCFVRKEERKTQEGNFKCIPECSKQTNERRRRKSKAEFHKVSILCFPEYHFERRANESTLGILQMCQGVMIIQQKEKNYLIRKVGNFELFSVFLSGSKME